MALLLGTLSLGLEVETLSAPPRRLRARAPSDVQQKTCQVCQRSYLPTRTEKPLRALCRDPRCEREHERAQQAALYLRKKARRAPAAAEAQRRSQAA